MPVRGDKTLPVPPLPPRTGATTTAGAATSSSSGSTTRAPLQSPPVTITNSNDADQVLSRRDAIQLAKRRWEEQCAVVRLDGHGHGNATDPAFDLLVIGCGGGPLETNLSSYLVKPFSTKWSDGCTSLEGGSTMGAIATLIEQHPHSFAGFDLGIGVDFEEQHQLLATLPPPVPTKEPGRVTRPKQHQRKQKPVGVGREGGGRAAGRVWDTIRSFAVTHAHLDHIQGLIISSGASLEPRPLYGLPRTLGNIDRVFDGGVWPKLAGYESDGVTVGRAYLYRTIELPAHDKPRDLSPGLSFTAFPVSHGMDPSMFYASKRQQQQTNGVHSETYDSTAFFVKESVTGQENEFLFFGDVEPDSISKRPLTRHVWQAAAPKIVDKKLSTIFLECSYPTTQPTEKLWGHLSPPFMLEELDVLAKFVVDERRSRGWNEQTASTWPLQGVTVVIIHIKDDILPLPPVTQHSHGTADDDDDDVDVQANSREHSPARGRDTSVTRPLSQLTLSPPEPAPPTRRPSSAYALSPFSWGAKRRWLESTTLPFGASSSSSAAVSAGNRRASIPWNVGSGGYGFGMMTTTTGLSPLQGPAFDEHGRPLRSKSLPGHQQPQHQVSEASASSSVEQSPRTTRTTSTLGNGLEPALPVVPHLHLGASSGSTAFSESVESLGESVSSLGGASEEVVMEEETVHERIERELNELEQEYKLGVAFLRAEQGMRIGEHS
ncbi:hypothetical protein ACM66B_006522 [Microbotryomycetes sp. NB124-2]